MIDMCPLISNFTFYFENWLRSLKLFCKEKIISFQWFSSHFGAYEFLKQQNLTTTKTQQQF